MLRYGMPITAFEGIIDLNNKKKVLWIRARKNRIDTYEVLGNQFAEEIFISSVSHLEWFNTQIAMPFSTKLLYFANAPSLFIIWQYNNLYFIYRQAYDFNEPDNFIVLSD